MEEDPEKEANIGVDEVVKITKPKDATDADGEWRRAPNLHFVLNFRASRCASQRKHTDDGRGISCYTPIQQRGRDG